jgi:hypothetical protein
MRIPKETTKTLERLRLLIKGLDKIKETPSMKNIIYVDDDTGHGGKVLTGSLQRRGRSRFRRRATKWNSSR